MLESMTGPVTVFAVWEPIEPTDPPPTSHMLGHLTDARVHQLWDPDHRMSDEMRRAELAFPASPPQARTRTGSASNGIMYDTVAIFPAGARWADTLPAPDYLEVSVDKVLPDLRRAIVDAW
jgi:hypothetical protein